VFQKIDVSLLVLCGSVASGKRKLAKILCEMFPSLIHIEVGERLRDIAKTKTGIGQIIADHQLRGQHVPDTIVFEALRGIIAQANRPVILDGFPRTEGQARVFATLKRPWYGVCIERDADFCRRLLQQRIDSCQLSGQPLRADDNMSTFNVRIGKYPTERNAFVRAVTLCGAPVYYTRHNVPELNAEVPYLVNHLDEFFDKIPRVARRVG